MSMSGLLPITTALVVQPLANQRAFVRSCLGDVGFITIVVENFHEAKSVLIADPPALLVADIRLEAYNGLHLVLHGKLARSSMVAIVTSHSDDRVLRSEAEALGAAFVVTPVARDEFMAAVLRTMFRQPHYELPQPPYERRRLERRQETATSPPDEDRRQQTRRREVGALLQSLQEITG
jgi:DNA-binding NtrC family response regulator